MIPREVPVDLIEVKKNENLSQFLLANDRSFVYSKVAAYDVSKNLAAQTNILSNN